MRVHTMRSARTCGAGTPAERRVFFADRRRGWARWRGPAADRLGRMFRTKVAAAVTGYNIIIIILSIGMLCTRARVRLAAGATGFFLCPDILLPSQGSFVFVVLLAAKNSIQFHRCEL